MPSSHKQLKEPIFREVFMTKNSLRILGWLAIAIGGYVYSAGQDANAKTIGGLLVVGGVSLLAK